MAKVYDTIYIYIYFLDIFKPKYKFMLSNMLGLKCLDELFILFTFAESGPPLHKITHHLKMSSKFGSTMSDLYWESSKLCAGPVNKSSSVMVAGWSTVLP